MRFKTLFLLIIFTVFTVDNISAKSRSYGRGSSRSHSSRGSSRGSSHGTSSGISYGTSYGRTSSGTSHGISHNGNPSGTSHGTSPGVSHGTSYGRTLSGTSHGISHHENPSGISHGTSSGVSHGTSYASFPKNPASPAPEGGFSSYPAGGTSGSIASQQNKNINSQFLNAEGGGATRPIHAKPAPLPYPTNSHPTAPVSAPTAGGRSGVVTEGKQTSPYQPSAPHDTVMKSSASMPQNQAHHQAAGQTNPPWSNPYLGTNKPAAPGQTYPPWSNPHLGNTGSPVSNSQPTIQNAYPSPIGFKDHVYPQTHPTSVSSPFYPSRSGNPPYPVHPMPPSGPWSTPSVSPSLHPTNSMPLGNPYSMHVPGGAAYNTPGHPYYPQQPHVLAQPAVQPFIPGQTIVMVPGQQDSGRGFGQMIKEALVYSTINAGVNRLINPHTHTHYVESRPDTAPTTTTHITYNNHYFNTPAGVNGTSPTNVPQATGSINNHPTGGYTPNSPQTNGPTNNPNGGVASNVGGPGNPSTTNGGLYTPNIPNTGIPNSSPVAGATGTPNATTSDTSNNKTSYNPVGADNTFSYRISDDELMKISEEIFAKSPQDLLRSIKVNLQTRVASSNVTDEAREPLFDVAPDLLSRPTIYVTRNLYDSYEYDFQKKLNRTVELRKNENLLIDTFLNTNEMGTAMQWLADRGFIDPDDFERKDVLRRIWFTIFSGSTCGFERVFAAENYGTAIVGVQDWIYFQTRESQKRIDYMGYVDKLDIGSAASLLKLNFQMDGIIRPNATIFVGTTPELEMSLYTICFYTRPNNLCPVSLAGTKFNIYTHSFTYFGNEVMDLGLPMF